MLATEKSPLRCVKKSKEESLEEDNISTLVMEGFSPTKTVKVPIVILIFSSLITIPLLMFSLFSLFQSFTEHQNTNLLEPNYKVLTVTKSSRLVLFLAFIVTFFSLGRCKTCQKDFESAIFHPSPSTYEFVSSTDVQGLCRHCDLDEEEDVDDDDHYDHDDGYIVGYVDEEDSDYYEDEEEDDDNEGLLYVEDFEVIKECNEDECTDLEKRVEEFIAKVTKKWKEESLGERLLLLAAA